MKTAIKIWGLAIVYQTFIYTAMEQEWEWSLMILLLTIELVGGLPSLFIYGAILHHLHIGKLPLKRKWIIAITGALLTALINVVLAVLFFGIVPANVFDAFFVLFIPAPLAALLALFSLALSVNEYFNENTIDQHP